MDVPTVAVADAEGRAVRHGDGFDMQWPRELERILEFAVRWDGVEWRCGRGLAPRVQPAPGTAPAGRAERRRPLYNEP
jgi:hypothetical protein